MKYRIILLCGLLSLNACIGNSRPTRYYLLSTVAENQIETTGSNTAKKPTVILVGPLELAKYLDRTNIVYRSGSNELIVSDFDAWAEGLDKSIVRSIAHNLSQQLPSESVTISSWQSLTTADIEISLAIDRFDCDDTGACHLRIFWTIKEGHDELSQLAVHEFTKRADSASISDQTKALSQLLADASQVLATEMRFKK